MKKRLISMCLIMALVLFAASAESNLRWSWENSENNGSYFRYQLDGGDVVETTEKVVYSENDGKSHVMRIWQSYDGMVWSKAAKCVYTPEAKASAPKKTDIAILVSPYSFQSILFTEDSHSINSKYGFGVELDCTYHMSESLRAGVELGFNSYNLQDTATLDKLSVVSAGAAFGYQKAFETVTVYVDANAGAAVNMIPGYKILNVYAGVKGGAEMDVAENLAVKAQLAAKASFQPKHMNSFNIAVTPSVGVSYTF